MTVASREELDLQTLLDFVKRNRNFDFTGYKRASLIRRIQKRMKAVEVHDYAAYVDYLQVDPEEFTHLFDTILINVTSFFRDPPIWDFLASDIVPEIVKRKDPSDPIRVWSAGCASGEEAYSAAILFAEALGREDFMTRVKIYGTDVDEHALGQARRAVYPAKPLQEVGDDLRRKYFTQQDGEWTFDRELRRALIFGRHDLVQDAPIHRVDLLLCRNVLMYLNSETQAKVMSQLRFATNDDGYVVLGKAEMLFTRFKYFTPVDLRKRVFRNSPGASPQDTLMMLAHAGNQDAAEEVAIQIQAREAAFEAGPIAQLVVDRRGHLVLANEKARTQLGLRLEDLGRPFRDLEISYLPVELRGPIEEVKRTRRALSISELLPSVRGGKAHTDIGVAPLVDESGSFLGASITFSDVTLYKELQDELEQANQELETAMEELQSTNEELETTNEELQSTNEELETTNEELQSTNEELETMNEELQSTNEELQAVNDAVRQRSGELDAANAFLQSILRSVRAAVVAVDTEMDVTMWNHVAEDLWGLRADEVLGRSLFTADIGLDVGDLKPMLQAAFDGGSDLQRVTADAVNRRGRPVRCQITCVPLRRSNGEIHGAILFIEVDDGGADRSG